MKILGTIALIIILLGGLYFLWPDLFSVREGGTSTTTPKGATTTQMVTYRSSEYGLSFEYQDTYALEERDITEGIPSHTITLAPKEQLANAPQNGEGPASITISIFDATSTTAEQWVRGSVASNFQLSRTGALSSTTIGTKAAVEYESDGLYASNNVVTLHEGRAYVLSVGWITREDAIVRDFEELLDTVSFQ